MPNSKRLDRGALEAETLAALAAHGGPMTPRQVQAELGRPLAYTTVMTTLSRLHDKGALTRERAGRAYSYTLGGDPDSMDAMQSARRMRKILEAGPDRGVALARFVSELNPDDERLLAQLLEQATDPVDPDVWGR